MIANVPRACVQEIGITGGEEDGVNNESLENDYIYSQPEDILNIYKTLSAISPYFSIAAGFGNVHGVYKPGNVQLHPELLSKHQAHVKEKAGTKTDKPVFLVFHGGSGSTKQEYLDAISYGVVKVNLDTDMQYAYMSGIRDYILKKKDYLAAPVGNPEGPDKPNKSTSSSHLLPCCPGPPLLLVVPLSAPPPFQPSLYHPLPFE